MPDRKMQAGKERNSHDDTSNVSTAKKYLDEQVNNISYRTVLNCQHNTRRATGTANIGNTK
jgi:hypothetical protein